MGEPKELRSTAGLSRHPWTSRRLRHCLDFHDYQLTPSGRTRCAWCGLDRLVGR